jgi:hypothetical protein
MQTNKKDPTIEMFEGLQKSLRGLDDNANSMIGAILGVNTNDMPADAKNTIERLKSVVSSGIVEKMKKSDNPVEVAEQIAKEWR